MRLFDGVGYAPAGLLSRRSLPQATILQLLGAPGIRTHLQPLVLLSLSLSLVLASLHLCESAHTDA